MTAGHPDEKRSSAAPASAAGERKLGTTAIRFISNSTGAELTLVNELGVALNLCPDDGEVRQAVSTHNWNDGAASRK